MTYKKDENKILRNGEEIYKIEDSESIPNSDYIYAILSDANVEETKINAFVALLLGAEQISDEE